MADVTLAVILVRSLAAIAAWVTVCYLAGRPAEVAANWREGRAWARARRAQAARARALLAGLPRAVAVLVLVAALRSHGRHRAGVGA
ncbi:hypothetical protein [Streptomyces sp. CA-111067]|uniref:hypothetical protein n=1 Tax=Streptomyces sp. CA-111067 TaxID=3240046 RepID=UPI003D99F515